MDTSPVESPINLQDDTIKSYLEKHPEKAAELTSTLMSAEKEISPNTKAGSLSSGYKTGIAVLAVILILVVGFALFKLLSL